MSHRAARSSSRSNVLIEVDPAHDRESPCGQCRSAGEVFGSVARVQIELSVALSSLERTPAVLHTVFEGRHEAWTQGNEGPGTWTPVETLTHMVHVEPSWMDRLDHVHRHADRSPFPLVDRTDHMEVMGRRPPNRLVDDFAAARRTSLEGLSAIEFDANRPGLHAELGPVTMGQLLAAWTVHDFNHLGQIVKTMAKQYRDAVGPWRRFLAIVDAP